MSQVIANPYSDLPEKSFWKTAVATRNCFELEGIWDPKFPIRPADKVVTFGSCFAQYIGRSLRDRGYSWHVTEQAPRGFSDKSKKDFGYDVFSCRTGNIYTTSLLKQWVGWAIDDLPQPDEHWSRDGRIYDPFRPKIEPSGFASVEEMQASRGVAVAAFRKAIMHFTNTVHRIGMRA